MNRTIIFSIIAVLSLVTVIFGNIQQVEAEIFTLRGVNDDISIQIINDYSNTVIKIVDRNGSTTHFDTMLREFKSGGFTLKNPETGLILYAHPIGEEKYKIVILTNEGFQRYITQVVDLNVVKEIISVPKSSLGADITKWDVPTNTTRPADSRKQ